MKLPQQLGLKLAMIAGPLMLLFIVSLLVWGCAQLGLEQPVSFNQRLAYVYSNTAAARTSAATQLKSGQISVGTADKVLTLTDRVRTAADTARNAADLNGPTSPEAIKELAFAEAVLTEVQQLLGGKP